MPTELLFRDDAYLPATEATVLAVNDRRGIVLDRTVFYATGGGQPGDSGVLERAGGNIAGRHGGLWRNQERHRPRARPTIAACPSRARR